jgi:hypothetical protein
VNFWHDLPGNFVYKNVMNELRFPLIAHTTYFNILFDRYGFLKSGFNSDLVLDRLAYRCLVWFLGHKMGETCWVRIQDLKLTCSAF